MASWHRNHVTQRDPAKAHKTRMREQGYEDGYAMREARYVDAEYQRSYRRGKDAREAQGWLP